MLHHNSKILREGNNPHFFKCKETLRCYFLFTIAMLILFVLKLEIIAIVILTLFIILQLEMSIRMKKDQITES